MSNNMRALTEAHTLILMRCGHRLTRLAHVVRYGDNYIPPWRQHLATLARCRVVWGGNHDSVNGRLNVGNVGHKPWSFTQ